MRKAKIKAISTSPFSDATNIIPASDYRPDWWKKQKPYTVNPAVQDQTSMSSIDQIRTIKACPAIHTHYQSGYILTAPCDMEIVGTEEDVYANISGSLLHGFEQGTGGSPVFSGHPHTQFNELDMSDFVGSTLKIDTGIQLVSNVPMNIMFLSPYWTHIEMSQNFVCMPGTMQISPKIFKANLGHEIVPNYLIKKNSHTFIKKGYPLLQFVPFEKQYMELEELSLSPRDKVLFSEHLYAVRTMTQVVKQSTFQTMLKHLSFKNGFFKSKKIGDGSKWLKSVAKASLKLKGFDDSDYTK